MPTTHTHTIPEPILEVCCKCGVLDENCTFGTIITMLCPKPTSQIYLWSIHPHDAQLEELELKGIIMVKGS